MAERVLERVGSVSPCGGFPVVSVSSGGVRSESAGFGQLKIFKNGASTVQIDAFVDGHTDNASVVPAPMESSGSDPEPVTNLFGGQKRIILHFGEVVLFHACLHSSSALLEPFLTSERHTLTVNDVL